MLQVRDNLSYLIDTRSRELYARLKNLNVDSLQLPEYHVDYFKTCHINRLEFSIQTSANLLYQSLRLIHAKYVQGITIMDYGAGVGSLYLLAKLIGCGRVVYNDIGEEWRVSAEKIAEALEIKIDDYIIGDTKQCLDELDKRFIQCNIIVSRNVIEHIYDLRQFYYDLYSRQPFALVYSSTTANKYNPAMLIRHVLMHRKWEKREKELRLEVIKNMFPISAADGTLEENINLDRLVRKTRGYTEPDIKNVIQAYILHGILMERQGWFTNTCDTDTGYWHERILSFNEYRALINDKRDYRVSFAPGFWDTHYKLPVVNYITRLFNLIIKGLGIYGVILAPFIYVIAEPYISHKKFNT